MAMLSIEEEIVGGDNVCVRVGGSLDRSAVYELRDRLLALPAGAVTLDLSGLGSSDDLALSVLAMWLLDRQRGKKRIELVGLSPHARRVLASFGFGEGGEAAWPPNVRSR